MPDFGHPTRMIDLHGMRLAAYLDGAGPLALMVHGFPESAYSWRHQMGPIAAAGFTACAIDVRGYGASGAPHPVDAYDMQAMVGDLVGVIDALSPEAPAVLIGHDWGAPMVWNTALIRPDRVRAVAGLSVPYLGPPTMPALDLYRAFFTARGMFFYQVYFQDEGVAEAELEADVRAGLRRFWYAISGDAPDGTWPKDKRHGDTLLHRLPDPDPFPAWMSRADEDFYVGQFARSGFRGPLNRYRTSARDFAYLSGFADRKITQPALFIGGERDLVLKMFPGMDWQAMMRSFTPGLRGLHLLEGCGHWTQQERPAEVTSLLLDWLNGL
jgi:pimeloyl-ACP methyl ester carboxylesterase